MRVPRKTRLTRGERGAWWSVGSLVRLRGREHCMSTIEPAATRGSEGSLILIAPSGSPSNFRRERGGVSVTSSFFTLWRKKNDASMAIVPRYTLLTRILNALRFRVSLLSTASSKPATHILGSLPFARGCARSLLWVQEREATRSMWLGCRRGQD